MKHNRYPHLVVDTDRSESLTSSTGAVLLRETIQIAGLDTALTTALMPWTTTRTVHDPAKVLLDLATAVAVGGDCVSDLSIVRAQPALFGPVASDPTVSRLISTLADDSTAVVAAIRQARARCRDSVWTRRRPLQGQPGSFDGGQVIVDLDATTVTAHSDKEHAEINYKRHYGHAPMCALVDHGHYGTGEPLICDLRRGGASPQGADLHISTLTAALAQLPAGERDQVLVRTDAAGCSKEFLAHITEAGLQYSIGYIVSDTIKTALARLPEQAWQPAVDASGEPRLDAHVAELTTAIPALASTDAPWPDGMRVIARREYPHSGAQLRLTDIEGRRYTVFATNTHGTGWTLPTLELRHRQRARAEDRIRNLKDTGLANLPFQAFAKNQIWLEIVCLATELLVWTQTLCWDPHAPIRRWEPKQLPLRILAVAGRIIRSGRRQLLRLPRNWPHLEAITTGWTALHTT
ncbi:IS1380 family transposase [Gordonia lacunae]|uniref:IS1380 family transposase n=1 Tax=Gordonia lacunae TaxID=417102 RepID=UPI0024479741|nr:IS1380 family transposase [Gordonia lacunae]